VTNLNSFENVKRGYFIFILRLNYRLGDIEQYAPQGCTLVMVGTMIDRENDREVLEENAQVFR
jgi:hypothetical protein